MDKKYITKEMAVKVIKDNFNNMKTIGKYKCSHGDSDVIITEEEGKEVMYVICDQCVAENPE